MENTLRQLLASQNIDSEPVLPYRQNKQPPRAAKLELNFHFFNKKSMEKILKNPSLFLNSAQKMKALLSDQLMILCYKSMREIKKLCISIM